MRRESERNKTGIKVIEVLSSRVAGFSKGVEMIGLATFRSLGKVLSETSLKVLVSGRRFWAYASTLAAGLQISHFTLTAGRGLIR
jgi:hypothetical protein